MPTMGNKGSAVVKGGGDCSVLVFMARARRGYEKSELIYFIAMYSFIKARFMWKVCGEMFHRSRFECPRRVGISKFFCSRKNGKWRVDPSFFSCPFISP